MWNKLIIGYNQRGGKERKESGKPLENLMNFPFEGNAAQQLVCFDVLTPFAWLAHYLMLSRNSIRQRYFRAPTMCYRLPSR